MTSVSAATSSTSMIEQVKNTKGTIDPYSILAAHIEAIGGEYEWKSDANAEITGEIIINGNTYDYYEWMKRPSCNKSEIWLDDTKIYASGDSGTSLWEYKNEEIEAYPDPESDYRTVREGLSNMDYLDPNNRDFTVTLDKVTYVDGKKNYRLAISNRFTDTVLYRDISAETFLCTEEIKVEGDTTIKTEFDDYQDVAGMMVAFHRMVTNQDSGKAQEINITKYKRNIMMESDLFDVPEPDDYYTSASTESSAVS